MATKEELHEENARLIDERLEAGLALLSKHYTVTECAIDPAFASPNVGGRPNHVRRFDIEGVGNLLVMTAKEVESNQLGTFTIMPYFKNLPLFSSDYVYNDDKRFFLIEVYDLAVCHDEAWDAGIAAFSSCAEKQDEMPPFPTQPRWYDDIRPVCIAKAPSIDQDKQAIECFLEMLGLFVKMEQVAPALVDENRASKWRKNKGYSDALIDQGGVSTDLWTAALGAENVRRFFDEVFFGAANYQ